MEIPVRDLRRYWNLVPKTVIHVGAHEGEEQPAYDSEGWGRLSTVWVEALPSKFPVLTTRWANRPNIHVVQALAWDVDDTIIPFHVMSNDQSSSPLQPLEHLELYPEIHLTECLDLRTRRLDSIEIIAEMKSIDFMCLDIQGSELHALKGLGALLALTKSVYSEVSDRELYKDGPSFGDLNEWLGDQGFHLVDWEILEDGWGDALWMRTPPNSVSCYLRRGARRLHNAYRQIRRRRSR